MKIRESGWHYTDWYDIDEEKGEGKTVKKCIAHTPDELVTWLASVNSLAYTISTWYQDKVDLFEIMMGIFEDLPLTKDEMTTYFCECIQSDSECGYTPYIYTAEDKESVIDGLDFIQWLNEGTVINADRIEDSKGIIEKCAGCE